MANSALNAVQAGLFNSIGAISGLGATVYDFVPQNAAYPYVRIALDDASDFDCKNASGREFVSTIHVWARAAGAKTIKDIMDKIYQRLHHLPATLSVRGFGVVNVFCSFTTSMVESAHDGGDKYQHGVMRFNIQLSEN